MRNGIAELTQAYQSHAVSPRDIVSRHLDAAESLGRDLNAFTAVTRDSALREARAAEERYLSGQPLSPIDGVPVSIKDLMHMAGTVTGCGTLAYSDEVQTADSAMVRQLRQAGAIIIGKCNLLEFAFGLVHPTVGPAHNPWNPALTIGGSSSGSAAAVAAGIGYLSIGTDTAGSVRNPAALGGVVGLKPSWGHYDPEGLVPLSPSLDHLGLLTNSVSDALLAFEALGGSTRAAKDRPRVAWAELGYTRPDIALATESLVHRMDSEVEWADPIRYDWDLSNAAAIAMITAEAYAVHRDWLKEHWAGYSAGTRIRLAAGAAVSGEDYIRARQVREFLRRHWARITDDIDYVLLPTLPAVASSEEEALVEDLSSATLYTSTFALLGLPAISIPAGLGEGGRPVGLQIVGRPGRDAELLAFAKRVEQERGDWPRPPHYADLY